MRFCRKTSKTALKNNLEHGCRKRKPKETLFLGLVIDPLLKSFSWQFDSEQELTFASRFLQKKNYDFSFLELTHLAGKNASFDEKIVIT